MKRLPILLLGLVVLVLGSCNLFNLHGLHGSWEFSADGVSHTWTFYPGDTMEWKMSTDSESASFDGTYEVSGDKLSIEMDFDGDKQEYEFIFEVQGDELKVWGDDPDEKATFKRK